MRMTGGGGASSVNLWSCQGKAKMVKIIIGVTHFVATVVVVVVVAWYQNKLVC